ncbi:amidophosphoribosyltransferase [Candidatus Finniella inopinata]|uniref:Amidophosphoribosyltransferase n=1 Tax=Candidatus Finniella inopinata TaxID=1696036 RepID=A0A4Q7DJH0_9PROT|nr:amidophosphoribosyltransferase [Candidatus Finniella inopinata]
MTTSVTLQECPKTLKQTGCKRVFVLTVARGG